jgi:hypothetical protein
VKVEIQGYGLKAVEKWGVGYKGLGIRIMEGVKQTKVKYSHSRDTENPLNIDLDINNKRQYCKIGTVCVCRYLWKGGR